MEKIYDTLRELPLLSGASIPKLTELINTVKFHFQKYTPGETIIAQGAPIERMRFVISGTVRETTVNADGRLRVSMLIDAPDVLLPQYFFGRSTSSPCVITAEGPAATMELTKGEYLRILKSDDVFLYNYLNRLSLGAQKGVEGVRSMTHGTLEERIAYWTVMLTAPRAREITVKCRLRDLYALYGVQRTAFVAALDRMATLGLLTYTRDEIRFPDRAALVSLLAHEE